jgi:hypothetical protein
MPVKIPSLSYMNSNTVFSIVLLAFVKVILVNNKSFDNEVSFSFEHPINKAESIIITKWCMFLVFSIIFEILILHPFLCK